MEVATQHIVLTIPCSPIWMIIVNVVALEMVRTRLPKSGGRRLPQGCSSSDSDPYSPTGFRTSRPKWKVPKFSKIMSQPHPDPLGCTCPSTGLATIPKIAPRRSLMAGPPPGLSPGIPTTSPTSTLLSDPLVETLTLPTPASSPPQCGSTVRCHQTHKVSFATHKMDKKSV